MFPSKRRLAAAVLTYWERVLWLTAALLLGWSARAWIDAASFQHRYHELLSTPSRVPLASPETPLAGARPVPGEALATLAIPRLGVDVVVAEGTSPDVLRRAAGRISSSALPGESGNVAIAAHRDSFFRPLRSIEPGDLVVLRGGFGERRYRVEWIRIVDPDEVGVVAPTSYPALTLVTCYPFRYVGNAPQRFIVRARILDPGAGATAAVSAGRAAV